jgi:threonine/homoserine/homoserine lactone efflux protein
VEAYGIINFPVFLAAGILLNLTPGTDTLYILGRSMAHGTRAGILSALGISTGSMIHTAAAATGLSFILSTSATAFAVVKYCGAVYLVYLGVRIFLPTRKSGRTTGDEKTAVCYRKFYVSGIITNVLNPKVALFFLAFLPQFIDPAYPHPVVSFLLLGGTFIVTGTCWCLLLAVFSARFSLLLQRSSRAGLVVEKLTGILFVGLGVKLALLER